MCAKILVNGVVYSGKSFIETQALPLSSDPLTSYRPLKWEATMAPRSNTEGTVVSLGPRPAAALLVLAQAFPADPPLSITALGVSQKDLIVLLWTAVSVSIYCRTRVSCFSRNSWYLFLKPKIRSFSKTFYFTWAVHQRHMTR